MFFETTYLICLVTVKAVKLQAVRSVASRGKFYQLPPDKENTDNRNRKSTQLRQQALAIVVLIKISFAFMDY